MSEKHTPEPWEVCSGTDIFTARGGRRADGMPAQKNDGWYIADYYQNRRIQVDGPDVTDSLPFDEQVENAIRAVACVNACAGIPTEALEAGAILQLVSASERAYNVCTAMSKTRDAEFVRDLYDAIRGLRLGDTPTKETDRG